MQTQPLVSIICLCFNHEKFVVESLQSVINQSYKNIELIVLDDCSNDNSVEMIEKWLFNYPEIQFIVNKKNLGNTKSFNKAAKFAKGEYLIDLAADDVLLPNCVAMQVAQFQNSVYKNLALVYGNVENINENGNLIDYYFAVDGNIKVVKPRKTGNIYLSVLTTGDGICSVSAMIKKSVFDTLGGYDESLAFEDLDFWIRASRQYDFDFIDAILVQKRTVSNAMSAHFYKPNHKINYTSYKILKKAIGLNQNLEEDLAIQKRVHFEIIHSYRNRNFELMIKNLGLKIWLIYRGFFKTNFS